MVPIMIRFDIVDAVVPLFGLTDVIVGGGMTVNGSVPLVPPGVVTLTVPAPV